MFLRASEIPDFPSWISVPTREEIVREGMNRVSPSKTFGFWILAFLAPAVIYFILDWALPGLLSIVWLVAFVLASAVAELPILAWQRRLFLRSIRGVLRERGLDICAGCGYSLDGLAMQSRCPECAAEIAAMPPVGPLIRGFVCRADRVFCASCNQDLGGLVSPTECPKCGGVISGLSGASNSSTPPPRPARTEPPSSGGRLSARGGD